jgi:ATP-dependent RNA helicase DeaD
VREHNVPDVDVAAALAVVLQGDVPLLLEPEPQRPARSERPAQGERSNRPERPERRPSRRTGDTPLATYRIAVGKRHKVEPRQIVGALANEGGLNRGDFGHIQIRPDFSLVELPAELPPGTEAALAKTRISGKLIELRLDSGAPQRKPRHKG